MAFVKVRGSGVIVKTITGSGIAIKTIGGVGQISPVGR